MKGWSLVDKETGEISKIGFEYSGVVVYTTVFDTKKGLLHAIDGVVEEDEEARRVEVTVAEKK